MKFNDKWVVADFETTTKEYYDKYGHTCVWLYAISNSRGEVINWGQTLDMFMQYCRDNLSGYTIYFHNLKFDGSFILNWLLNKEYQYKDRLYKNDNKGYTTLISEEGAFYQITINFRKGCQITIQDSLKLLPFSVKNIAYGFNLPIKKGEIDYNNYTITDEVLDYVFNDVSIVALALNDIKTNGMNYMTTASCAYHNFLDTCIFANSFFPVLDEEFLIEWRKAYRGGRSQVNPIFKNVILHNVKRYDINSMYPYIMHDMELPIGMPIKCEEIGKYKFELYKVDIEFSLKDNHLPTLLKKNTLYGDGSYYEESDGIIELHISSIDYQILLRHYDIKYIKFIEIWGFKTTTCLFKNYIDKWYKVKNENTGAKRIIAKLMLNSLYGKFGSNCKGKSKIPLIEEDGSLGFKLGEEVSMRKYYLPIAIAITSYAHLLIDDAIMETGYDNFVYCDTDSVHTLGTLPMDMVDKSILGKFKLEGIEIKSKYVRQKTYIFTEFVDNELEYVITCAGMDDKTKNKALSMYGENIFDVFQEGFEITGTKLMPKQVKGGVILVETSFKIKE